jgi:cyanophycinase
MGGGTDVDAAFVWMINKSGGGDFVVIRATGTDAYNPYIFELGTVDSVETVIIKSRAAASDPFVVDKIRNAEALFIAGGDQFNYVSYWKGTPVEDAIHYLVTRNVPIGGTSAGLAVMGQFLFSAANGTIDSPAALGNPYNNKVALDRDFLVLPNMGGIITDSHFVTRDRMGRLVTFLARIVKDGWAGSAKGIGIDEMTAIAVEANGTATVLGSGAAYFLRTPGAPEVCQAKKALTYRNLSVYRVSGSATFNFSTWTGNGGTAYTLTAENGVLTSTQAGGGIY